ncbi:MAG: hypothetical protein HRU38_11050 [Saccharospirillaceae bacterium]|nr:hypothetical protein [Saccharospirillaceae bacterium]
MNTPITFEIIQSQYEQELAHCMRAYHVDSWQTKPQKVGFTNHKTKYGLAMTNADVLINKAFIGTKAYNQLKKTIRHELAHFAVGLKHCHDNVFKMCLMVFDGDISVPQHEIDEIESNISFKWQVYANLEDGNRVYIGGVHKKTKTYTDYNQSERKNRSYKGVKVNTFDFELTV